MKTFLRGAFVLLIGGTLFAQQITRTESVTFTKTVNGVTTTLPAQPTVAACETEAQRLWALDQSTSTKFVCNDAVTLDGVGIPPTSPFPIGSQVETTATANVRPIPVNGVAGAPPLGSQPGAAVGTVIAGPLTATLGTVTYQWLNLDFGTGKDGWVAADFLKAHVATPIACVMSAWTTTSSVLVPTPCTAGSTQTRTDTQTRTVVTQAANGAPACPTNLTQTLPPTTQPCGTVTPPGTFTLRTPDNTGLKGAGINEASLVAQGSITYGTSSNGQTISGKKFTGPVTISGSNITISGCLFSMPAGGGTKQLTVTGANNTVTDSTFRPQSGSNFDGILMESGASVGPLLVQRVDISKNENNISVYGGSLHLVDSYLHDTSNTSSPGGHTDGIEIYGGTNHVIERNSITQPTQGSTAPINIAPFGATSSTFGSVKSTTIQDNYLDGGNMHWLVDLQSSGTVTLTRFLRNHLGGHTSTVGGSYFAFNNVDGRKFSATEAALQAAPNNILWPSTGADVNVWDFCINNPLGYPNLSPNKTGQTVTP